MRAILMRTLRKSAARLPIRPQPLWPPLAALLLGARLLAACDDEGGAAPEDAAADPPDAAEDVAPDAVSGGEVVYSESREPCEDRNPLRNVYFGDLHVHTGNSFDAWAFDVRSTPEDAYAFAQGGEILLPPLGEDGQGTVSVRLDRPLDFAAVTDHSEYLAEVDACLTPESAVYATSECVRYREGGNTAIADFGIRLSQRDPERDPDLCGPDAADCPAVAGDVWQRIQQTAEDFYDRTAACRFTTFVAYEYTAAPNLSNLHRNIIFRNASVPALPVSYFEEPSPWGLFEQLRAGCLEAGTGCDVLSIPHNSNWSNGNLFDVEYPGAEKIDQEREMAAFRAALEPLVEIYQHKGDSECLNGLSGIAGASDELCDFEKLVDASFQDCGDGTGAGAMTGFGCTSRLDYVRYVLMEGLREEARLGVNPYPLGIIASTDTHNAIAGSVAEDAYRGHWGSNEDTPEERLSSGTLAPGGIIFGPGGLAAVWAVENSRDALFEALRRRETYGTSGPRIAVRFFGGWGYPEDLCQDPALVAAGYAGGVPMGGTLPPPSGEGAPRFVVTALRDPGTAERPGTALQRMQVIKGWIDADGGRHQAVYDVAGDADNGASVDLATCEPSGDGFDSLCAVWSDPEFDPSQRAFYYARVVENPTCRWSTWQCNALPEGERPGACTGGLAPRTVQERAWTSPIWYRP